MSIKTSLIKMLIDVCVQILMLFRDNVRDDVALESSEVVNA